MSISLAAVADQAGTLRAMAERRDRTVVAVVGAKGGVGASSVTLSLAAAITEPDVVAIDAHWGQKDLAAVARLWHPNSPLRIVALSELLIDAPYAPTNQNADDLFDELACRPEGVLVIDAGPASTPWANAIARRADKALLVATPDRLAALNSYAAAKRLRQDGVDPLIAWNGCHDASAADSAQRRLRLTCEKAGAPPLDLAGWLPTHDVEGSVAARGAYRLAAVRIADRLHPGGRAHRLERQQAAAA